MIDQDQARKALRKLDEARLSLRLAHTLFAVATLASGGVIALWFVHLSNDYSGAGYVWKVIGLVVLSIAMAILAGVTGTYLHDMARAHREARYEYEDVLIEAK